jgi:predicted exporter
MKATDTDTHRAAIPHVRARRVALTTAIGGWSVLLLSPFGGAVTLSVFPYSFLLAGALGIVASLLCLFFGMPLYPEQRRPWLLPKLLSFPLAIFGAFAGMHFIPGL